MNIRRKKAIEKEISRIIFNSILIDVKNDKIRNLVSVKSVELSKDARYADILVSILKINENVNTQKIFEQFCKLTGFFRKKIADEIEIRYIPELRFHLDDTVEYSIKIAKLLNEVKSNENGD